MNCQPCGVIVRLVFGLQVHGRQVPTVSCRGGARAGRQLWRPLLDQGASGDGRRVSWFAPQNQGGGRRLKTPSRGGTGIGLGTDGGDGRRRRLGPRRGGGNLPAREVLAAFRTCP